MWARLRTGRAVDRLHRAEGGIAVPLRQLVGKEWGGHVDELLSVKGGPVHPAGHKRAPGGRRGCWRAARPVRDVMLSRSSVVAAAKTIGPKMK